MCDFPMLLQARAMHGQAPLQRSDPSSQPVCKVRASTRLLLVPLFASAYLAASLDLHSVGYNAVCIARSHAHTDIQGIEDNHHILSSLPIQFCQTAASLLCRVSLLTALNIFCWMPPAQPWGCAPACPTTPPSWTSCRSSHCVIAWHECLKLFFKRPAARMS